MRLLTYSLIGSLVFMTGCRCSDDTGMNMNGGGCSGSNCPADAAVIDISGPPVVTVTRPANGAIVAPTVTFDFAANRAVSSYTCTLNSRPVTDCTPGMVQRDLPSGSNTFTVLATDAANTQSAVVSVTFTVNRPPTIGDLADITTLEDTPTAPLAFTISDSDTAFGNLVVTLTIGAELPIPTSGIIVTGTGANRSVELHPAPNAFGTTALTITVTDGQVTTSKTVPVTVLPVNDPPTIDDIQNKGVAAGATLGPVIFHINDIETAPEALVVTATSSSSAVIPVSAIALGGAGTDRTFSITPVVGQSGPVTITLTVSDGDKTSSDAFIVTAGSTDAPPTISDLADQTTAEDTPKTVSFTVGDPDTDLNLLTPSATFASGGLVASVSFGGSGANRTLTVTPKSNQTGSALVTITIADAVGSASDSFLLTVINSNDPPTISPPANQTIAEDTSTGSLIFSVGDTDSPTVTVTAESSNTTLIPAANVVITPASGAPGSRNVTVTPVANGFGGPVTITLTASDGVLSASGSFTVTVTSVNDLPTLSDLPDLTVEPNTSTGALAFTIGDADGDPLTVTTSSSDVRVAPASALVLAGTGTARTLTIVPANNEGGPSTITLTVNDGHGGTASDTFVLSVKVRVAGVVGSGNGTVSATGTGCTGGTAVCTSLPGAGTVTFVANPAPGERFAGWSGGCTGSGDGVVTPIPTSGVTCTATFRTLWARLFHTPDDVTKIVATSGRGAVETTKAFHYLGSVPRNTSSTAIVWNAAQATGALQADSAFQLTQDGAALPPVDIVEDPNGRDGTVVLVNATPARGSGLIWLDRANAVTSASSYADRTTSIVNAPYAMVALKTGLVFLESTHNTNPQAVYPTYGQLVRVDTDGKVVTNGTTRFLEGLGACQTVTLRNIAAPVALGFNTDGDFLVVSWVAPLDGSGVRTNLTLFDSSGTPKWGKHVEAASRAVTVAGANVASIGTSYFVSGIMGDPAGSLDGFAMRVERDGTIAWWRSFGTAGVVESTPHAVIGGSDLVLVGYTVNGTNGNDAFALRLKGDGSAIAGQLYGGTGGDTNAFIFKASDWGFHLFGSSTTSFGNSLASSWAMRVDPGLKINFTGPSAVMTAYSPTLVTQGLDNIADTCVDSTTFAIGRSDSNSLNVNGEAITIGGVYQAGP